MQGITEKQQEVLNIIRRHMELTGQSPTIREICRELGVSSTCTAHKHLTALEKKGLISKSPYGYRSIEIPGEFCPSRTEFASVPLVGHVAAGQPLLAAENIDSYIPIPIEMVQGSDLFALKVRGESMKDAGIMDGDIIVAKQQQTANNGDIVVALVDEEGATVKRFYRENGRIRLQPENDALEPIIADDVHILGKVALSIRQF